MLQKSKTSTEGVATNLNADCLCMCMTDYNAVTPDRIDHPCFTREQARSVSKLRDLSRVLSDYVVVIEGSEDPSTGIQEAIEAIDYYSRLLHTMQKQ